MDIETVAEDLYGLPPEEFTAARDAAAKAATDQDTRAAIKALRKPTAGAHAVNLLIRERPDEVDALLDLGEQLRAAMGRDAGAVRRLTEERRDAIGVLVDRDLPVSVQQDVTATLEAATAEPELGAAVRAGRLVKPLRYAGFGAMPDLDDAVATPVRLSSVKPASTSTPAKKAPAKASKATAASKATKPSKAAKSSKPAAPAKPDRALAEARKRCLELSGIADDAQRRYEVAVKNAAEARRVLDELEKERAEAKRAARAAHAEAEQARREVGRLERS